MFFVDYLLRAFAVSSKLDFNSFLDHINLGWRCVAWRGIETILKSVRHYLSTEDESSDFVILKFDCGNAFNSIYRDALLAQVRQHFPELSKWVGTSFGCDSNLLYGSFVFMSSEGVQ